MVALKLHGLSYTSEQDEEESQITKKLRGKNGIIVIVWVQILAEFPVSKLGWLGRANEMEYTAQISNTLHMVDYLLAIKLCIDY